MWDNATGSPLKGDPKIKFVDTRNKGVWVFNETVIYDTNSDGFFNSGDKIIAQVNGTLRGTPPALGTLLTTDSRIRFGDLYNSNAWSPGDPVAYENDTNNVFDPGEVAIVGIGGNFWGNYNGLDNGSHGFAGDGIGDTLIPTPCPYGGRPCLVSGPPEVDWYPLVTSWKPSNLNITIMAKPLGGYPPLQISFTASTRGGAKPYAYRWNFGDGSVSPQQNTTHTYSAMGAYVTTLTVTDALSSSASNYISITVLAPVGNLALKVLDQGMKAIQGANVTLLATPAGQPIISALTNNLGSTTFVGLVGGSYLVQASSPGYLTATKNVTVVPGQTTNDQLVLLKVVSPNIFPWVLVYAGTAAAVATLLSFLLVMKRRKKPSLLPDTKSQTNGGS
jgi:PKD repeat protein